jgi:hypothetical protein
MYVLVIGQLNEKDAGPRLSGSTARLKGWGDQGTCSLTHAHRQRAVLAWVAADQDRDQ